MQRLAKVLALLFVGGLGFLLIAGCLCKTISIPPYLSELLWVLPFSAASASLVFLTGSLALGLEQGRRIPAHIASAMYLVCCPSLAILGLSSSLRLGVEPPIWIRFAAPTLVLASAWVYYRLLDYSDEELDFEPLVGGWTEAEL